MPGITNKKQFTMYILLILAILIVVNSVSRSLFFRWDVTDNKMYSLSNSSKSVIEKLDDRMVAKVFFSKDLPGQVANSRRYLQDMLEEYEAYSGGDFHFEFINPDENEDAQSEARNYGIPPVQIQVVENDKLEIKNVYMGLALLYNDKKEVIPVIQTTEGLEYDLTTAIKKITSTGKNKVGLIANERDGNSTKQLRELLGQTYTVRTVDPEKNIPLDIQTIMMNGYTDSLSQDALYHLDQFLMGGGKLFMAQSHQTADLQKGFATDIKSNIFDFMEHYGVKLGTDILTDKKCSQIQVQQQQGFFRMVNAVEYPVFPLIHNFNKEHIIVKNLEEARVFFTNEIMASDTAYTFTSLMKTSDKTGAISGPYYNIYPIKNAQMNIFPNKSKTVSAYIEGSFSFYFSDNNDYEKDETYLSQNDNVQLIVIGDLEFFNDGRGGGIPENVEFIMNAIDYLNGDSELVEIRSRGVTARPLEEISDSARQMWKWVNVLLPALLVILMGLYRWKQNRDKRHFLEELYG